MIHPKISFKISKKKDLDTLFYFIDDAKYDDGRNLDWAVFKKYSYLKKYFYEDKYYKVKNKKNLMQFIDDKYLKNKDRMKKDIIKNQKRWKKIEVQYFLLIDKLFSNYKWPKGKYIAFGTIWGMYPRFLEDKTFQIPYTYSTPKYINVVIAHELLHFIFYDYFFKRYPKYESDKYDFFVWNVSEIFNIIVQNSPEWIKYFKFNSLGYPEHKKVIMSLSKTWHDKSNLKLDELTDDIIQKVEKF